MKLRKECVAVLFLAVVFMMAFALSPASAAEFVYDKAPAFGVTYPDEWKASADNPDKVLLVTKVADSLPVMNIQAKDLPAGVALADVNTKTFKGLLEKGQNTNAEVKETKAISLGCGTPASMSLLSWAYQGWMPLLTRVVSAYKGGKWVYVSVTTSDDGSQEVPQSLKFK